MRRFFLTTSMVLFSLFTMMGQISKEVSIEWSDKPISLAGIADLQMIPSFEHAMHDERFDYFPVSVTQIALPKGTSVSALSIEVRETGELLEFIDKASLNDLPQLEWEVKDERGIPKLIVHYLPYSKDLGALIVKYRIKYVLDQNLRKRKTNSYASSSVMAVGDWYKIGVVEDGVYQMKSDDLEQLGIDVENLDPQTLNIFGNGYGQLPYENSIDRPDDLLQTAIYIEGEADGSFDDSDYILFYANGPNTWKFDESTNRFKHSKHLYSDSSYYFIGINTSLPAKRIQSISSTGSPPTVQVNTFNDFAFHEIDRENVLKSGRSWYGEKFDVQTTYFFEGDKYTFPNILASDSVYLDVAFMGRNTVVNSKFTFSVNGAASSVVVPSTGIGATAPFGKEAKGQLALLTSSPSLNVSFSFDKKDIPSASGWLDWFELNLKRELRMARSQMKFRNSDSFGEGGVAQYFVANAQTIQEIWKVTDPANVKRVNFELNQDVASYTIDASELEEFIAFTDSDFLVPSLEGQVPNQNLHSLGTKNPIDMVIVSPSLLVNEAEQLADLHRNYPSDPLSVEVVKLSQVYNEFSSGMRDVTAIKWLMKMLYDRAKDNMENAPRHVLLFGDGSYDNVNFSSNNSNLVPTYQSENSLSPTSSFVSDDYFGLLSDDDGEANSDLMDISVGRLTVKNRAEASSVVNKISRYMTQVITGDLTENNSAFGSWRNTITLVADDEDGNDHMDNSRQISAQIESYSKTYNIERVFTDAFQQIATPGGDRYPDVNSAIDRRVRNGAFIINYIGHGGESGWAQERILDIPTILEWDNTNRMPIFMTATCEFTRFDDPLRTSGGELVLLNAAGGGIALLTTTRLVYALPNFRLNQSFYDALFQRPLDENITRLGDVYRDCKNGVGSSSNYRNFSLIGDPALPMAIPKYNVEISSITDTLNNPIDTLKALGIARVNGKITTGSTNVTQFDGVLEATVFDRVKIRNTLANDGGTVFTYPTQEDVIYRGVAEVKNGQFSFDFVLPKDIPFITDTTARISLYAFSRTEDAAGFRDELTIGGRDQNAIDDGVGPSIDLFMNDENFVFGGYTDAEPILLANIIDPNGINTVGTGIGHDISAVLDGDIANTLILNDYYTSDLNTFESGSVRYPFDELSPGSHSVEFKVWDVHNNSNKSSIDFIVAESEELAIERVLNYPNPFTTSTEFFFEHNQSAEFLNVLIEVYTVTGKLVKSINTVSNTDGFRNEPISWNGRDDFGDKLATGTYVYKVSVKNQSGDKDMKFEKLVILN